MVKYVSILGSTGSIGRQSLDIIGRLPQVRVAALTAGTSVERMARQCREFLPSLAVMATQEAAERLAEMVREIAEPKVLYIMPHEPLTGAHVGPGMLALFFLGDNRLP